MSDYTEPRLRVGTNIAGFEVTEVLPLPEVSGYAHVMRHMATGARMLWIATDDDNKSFAISFKTPPANDKGVFHILEHSVLCGSDRFPVKEPFVNLLKTSMQTFLNALTFADKTMYPVASTNTADLENLMDVYLDAVLHPAIYHRPRIFEQEGWHYEITDEGELVYNGVVFNEMKGATSDPDDVLLLALDQALFPDTPYRFESGGDPRAIPTLSYEEFLDNHRRHYNLANSYVILYGDMDIERELKFVGERLSKAEQRDAGEPNPLPLQEAICAGYSKKEMFTAPENAAVALAFVVGTAADRERVLATDILFDAIAGSNEAPLKRAVLKAGLGDDFRSMLMDGELQPRIILQLKGAKEGVAAEFESLVQDTCAQLVRDGIPRELLEASMAQAEFNLREQDFGSYPSGVALSMQVMSSWLYDDDRPVDYLRYEDEIAHMRANLENGYFEQLLQDLVCDSKHCATVELVPVEEGANAEEAAELADKLASLTPEEIEQIKAEVAGLREEQEMPDAAEDLAKLPQLSVADIDEPKQEPELLHEQAPLPCLAHEMDTRRIDYVYHYFGLHHLNYEDLPYAGVLCELLGKLSTEHHSAAELDTLVELNLGTLDFFCETRGKDDDLSYAAPMLIVGASALSEKVDELARIPQEIWGETRFDDTERIYALLQQRRITLEQHFVNAGHAAAITRLSTYWSAASKVAGAIGGVDYYLFLKQLLANWDAQKDELVTRLGDLAQRIFVSDDVTVSFTGSAEDRKRFWEVGGTLGLSARTTAPATLEIPALTPCNEAFVIPSNVSYVGASMAPSEHDKGCFGIWNVAQRALAYDYLWNEVRVKGGAYGTGFRRTHTAIEQFWSYRDPGIDATLARYDAAGAWLEQWSPSDEELTGYIVSTVANHDAPVKPRQMARRQDSMYFSQRPDGWRDQIRAQELGATADAVRALAEPLKELGERRCVCVFAPREAIKASSVKFDKVIDLMG